jgi:uncharacterized protein
MLASPLRSLGHTLSIVALRDVPFWTKSWLRRVCRVFAFAFYAYVGCFLVLLSMESRFLFVPSSGWATPPKGTDIADVTLTSADGSSIHSWWTAPADWTPKQGAILYAHGNGGNLSYAGGLILEWRRELKTAVLIFDYPGYGKSSGSPSEEGCYAAGHAAYDWLLEKKGVRQQEVVLLGGSMGGAVATELAVHRPGRALVLLSTFTSFPDMAQQQFPFFPGRWFVHNQMNNLSKIAYVHCPVFVAHGTADELIPFSQGERLYATAHEPKLFHPRPEHPHNDYPDEELCQSLRNFLSEFAPRTP